MKQNRAVEWLLLAAMTMVACGDDAVRESEPEEFNLLRPREEFYPASLPAEPTIDGTSRRFTPTDRCYTAWHRPVPGVRVRDLAPWSNEEAAREVLPAIEMDFISSDEVWGADEFGGVMRGFSGELDLSGATAFEFWVNDFTGDGSDDQALREGILHVDFGWINEDFWWPAEEAGFTQLTFQTEDRDGDSSLTSSEEDTGLDGIPSSEESQPIWPQRPGQPGDPAGDDFDATPGDGFLDFPYLNGGERNQRLDTEDLNGNAVFDLRDGYFTVRVDLADVDLPLVDIYRDYTDFPEFLAEARAQRAAWRKYRIPLTMAESRLGLFDDGYMPTIPDMSRIQLLRVWYENPEGTLRAPRFKLILTQLRFVPREEEAPKNPLGVNPPRAGG